MRKKRRHVPGAQADQWVRGGVPGGIGQYQLLNHPYRYVGDSIVTDRLGWPVDDLAAFTTLDWADGDGVNPAIGNIWTPTGVITPGLDTPWVDSSESRVTASQFVVGSHLTSAVDVDPPLGQDFVFALGIRLVTNVAANILFATRAVTAGWRLYINGISLRFFVRDTLGGTVQSQGNYGLGWGLISLSYDEDGNQRLYFNGTLIDTDNVAGLGYIGSAEGLGLACRADGAQSSAIDVSRALYWRGVGIADLTPDAWHAQLAQAVLGMRAIQGVDGAFTRNSSASWQNSGGVWHIAAPRCPRAGDVDGHVAEPLRVNKAYHNIDPQAGDAAAALTWTGAVAPTEVDDSAALLAADAREWGPNTFDFNNTTGVVQYIRMSAQTGNVNAHSLQCLIRRVAGVGAINIGLYDEVGLGFVGVAVTEGYATRTQVHGQVPVAATCTLCLEVANGVNIRWGAHDMGETPRCQLPIPNAANAATATKALDDFVTSEVQRDEQGSFELTVTPLGWSGAENGITPVVFITGSGLATLYVNAGGTWELQLDGTTLLDSGVAPADGVAQRIRVRWKAASMSIDVDGVRVAGVYDGALIGAGQWEIATGGTVEITDFITYRNGDG